MSFDLISIVSCLALEPVRNVRIISTSSILREIQVEYDKPNGCFDRLTLICEMISSKQRKLFTNSTVCADLIPNEFYRIYVETRRIGWENVISDIIQTQLVETSNGDTKKSILVLDFE
jgi:hypothetical protein